MEANEESLKGKIEKLEGKEVIVESKEDEMDIIIEENREAEQEVMEVKARDGRGEQNDVLMEENNNQGEQKDEEMQDASSRSESSDFNSDEDEQILSRRDDELDLEKPLSEEEIDELISDLLAVESKAAEAQEALEKESLSKVESEVREELAQALRGDEVNFFFSLSQLRVPLLFSI
jgi:transcriptional regulator ATRX